MNEEQIRLAVCCCLLGLSYLHKKRIIHRVLVAMGGDY